MRPRSRLAWWFALVTALSACPHRGGPAGPALDAAPAPVGLGVGDSIPLSGPIAFEYDDAQLRPSSLPILDEAAAYLLDHPALVLIEVQGHLADDPTRHVYGRKLSEDRAESVRDYLVHAGIAPDRLTAQGYEANVPLVSNDTEEGRRKNRRIELRIIRVAP